MMEKTEKRAPPEPWVSLCVAGAGPRESLGALGPGSLRHIPDSIRWGLCGCDPAPPKVAGPGDLDPAHAMAPQPGLLQRAFGPELTRSGPGW